MNARLESRLLRYSIEAATPAPRKPKRRKPSAMPPVFHVGWVALALIVTWMVLQ